MKRRASVSSAVLWSTADALLRQGASFAATVILARLLSPDDFGAVAALSVFLGLADVFINGGLSASLTRNPDSTREEESSVFYFNLSVAALLAMLLALCAPLIARFFKAPILLGLTYAMALNLFLGAFGTIQITLLERSLDFRTTAKVGLSANFCASVVAIVMAYRGFGAWSLAAQSLTSTTVTSVLLWTFSPWRPSRGWNFACLRKHLQFGSFVLLSRLLESASFHLNSVLVARLFSTRDLAFYTRATGTQQVPVNLMTGILSRVALPVFASDASDPVRLTRAMGKAQNAVMWLNIPSMLGLMILAEPFVVTVFGEKWAPSVPILQVLTLVGLILPMRVFTGNVILALGHSKFMFKSGLLKKGVGITLTVVASFHGVLAMAWAQVATAWFTYLVNAYFTHKLLGYGARGQLRDLTPYWLLGTSMAALLWLFRAHTQLEPWLQLVVFPTAGASLYLLASRLLRLPALEEVLRRVKRPKSSVAS